MGTSNMMDYNFLHDSYSGGGGFLDGRYIIPHPREDNDKLINRRQLSHYSNFVKPVVDSLVNPVFRRGIVRDWDQDNEMLSGFMNDVDKTGENMNRFMKRAAIMAKLYGSVFIVVDNAKKIVRNKKQALKERQYPYVYLIPPAMVRDYKCDSFGNIISIEYEVEAVCSKGIRGYKMPSSIDVWTWSQHEWSVVRDNGTAENGLNLLGRVPIVCLRAADCEAGDLMPLSPVMSIARTNLAIFNLQSELRELLRNQAFSVLCYPITQEVSSEEALEGVRVGVNDMLLYDGSVSKAPYFIAPDSSQAQLLQGEISRLVEDIYRQACLTSVVAVQTKASGVAKQWDFEQTNQVLTEMSENCEIAEKRILNLWGQYMGVQIEYKVLYPREFGIVDISAELDKVAQALNLNVGIEFARQAKIKATEVFLNDIPDSEYDAVINEIRNSTEEYVYNIPTGGNGVTYNIQGKAEDIQGVKMNGIRGNIKE